MGIPKGVTLIVGGGFHGKSTLLNAIQLGIYNHIPGDGREFVCTDPSAFSIRAEDGEYDGILTFVIIIVIIILITIIIIITIVSHPYLTSDLRVTCSILGRSIQKVDIRPFINNLPFGRDTSKFSTQDASGSTSQAANIIEALETGTKCLLIDEVTP